MSAPDPSRLDDPFRAIRALREDLGRAVDRISVLEEHLAAVEALASGELQRSRESLDRLSAVVEGFTEVMRATAPGRPGGPLGTVHPIRPEEDK